MWKYLASNTNHTLVVVSKVTEMAGQLQAVMQKNPKKARVTCTRAYKQWKAQDNSQDIAVMEPQNSLEVWEVSDEEEGEELPPLKGPGRDILKKPSILKVYSFCKYTAFLRGSKALEINPCLQTRINHVQSSYSCFLSIRHGSLNVTSEGDAGEEGEGEAPENAVEGIGFCFFCFDS